MAILLSGPISLLFIRTVFYDISISIYIEKLIELEDIQNQLQHKGNLSKHAVVVAESSIEYTNKNRALHSDEHSHL